MKSGEIKTIPYEDTTETFKFYNKEELIECTFGLETSIKPYSPNPIAIKSKIQLKFKETKSFEKLMELYSTVKIFLTFITYRQNIDISEVTLYGKTEEKPFTKVGTLYYDFEQVPDEEEEVINKTIPYELIKTHIDTIFEEITADRLYIQHIPESQHARNRITPARFVLTTAAFEWIVRSTYTIPANEKQEMVKVDFLNAVRNLPVEKGYNRKLKTKYNFLIKLIEGIDVNLAGKITYIRMG